MMYNVYDYRILSPSKCGTRYLDTVFDIIDYTSTEFSINLSKKTNLKKQFFARQWKEWRLNDLLNIEWIVIRPPEEITISGINTELLLAWNAGNTLLSDEKKLIDKILFSNTGHYDSTLFKQLYFFYLSLTKLHSNQLKFIHLKDLTAFAKEHLSFTKDLSNIPVLHDFSNFPIFINKAEMLDYFKRTYINEWFIIENNIKIENFFWELIQKNCEFYEPKKINKQSII